jgi:hypothetical protein
LQAQQIRYVDQCSTEYKNKRNKGAPMFNIKKVWRSSITIANRLPALVIRVTLMVCAASALHIAAAQAQVVQWTKYATEPTVASVRPQCNYQGSDRNFAKDSAGNFYVVGGASELGQGAVIYKFNGITGALLWRQNYVGAGNRSDCATSLALDGVGNVAITGYTSDSSGTPTTFVAKYNGVTGDLIWNVVSVFTNSSIQFGYIQSALAVDTSGNIIVTNLATTKYDGKTGAELWTTRTSSSNGATGSAVVIDSNGDAYLNGWRIIKLSGASGAEIWNVQTSTASSAIYSRTMRLSMSNELVVAGYAEDLLGSKRQIATVKYSRQTGSVIWEKQFTTPSATSADASDVVIDFLGNIVVTGYTFEPSSAPLGAIRLTVLKYSSEGTQQWATQVLPIDATTEEGAGVGRAVATDANGNIFVTGEQFLPVGAGNVRPNELVTLKFSGVSGAEQWRKTYTLPNGGRDGSGVAILFDAANDPAVLGYTADLEYRRSVRILKYVNANGALKAETSSNLVDAPGEAQSTAVDNNGNVIVAGTFGGTAAISSQMTKYDGATGQELWSVAKPLSYRPLLVTAANGDIYYAGNPFFPSPPVPGMRVQKHSSTTGQLLWEGVSDLTTLGFSTVAVTDANSDIYITGTTRATLGSSADSARTVKFSGATGVELWKNSYSGNVGDSRGVSIAILPDGHVIATMLAGETSQQGTSTTVRVEKQNKANGAVIWSSTIGSVFYSGGNVIVDASGDVFVAARVSNALDLSNPVYLRVTKFSGLTGALIWKVDRSSNSSAAIFLSIDASGNPLVGHSEAVTKLDGQTGNPIWMTPFLGTSLNDIRLLSTGQVAASGWSYGADTGKDMRLVLYDGLTGSPVWSYAHDGGASADDNLFAFAAKGTSLFLAGSSQRLTRKPSWFVQKLSTVSAPAPFPLTLITNGTGGGNIASSPAGLPCEPTCNGGLYSAGAIVTITPTPRADSVFAGWSGGCTGSGICRVTMSKAQFVAATFNLRKVPLNVAFVGSGGGAVVSEPTGLNCSANCSVGFNYGSTVVLRATANPGSTFLRWGGACRIAESNATCNVQIGDVNEVTVTFSLGVDKLTVRQNNGFFGGGLVTSIPSGISCGVECIYTFPRGTVVSLVGVAASGSIFNGWDGPVGCTGLAPCTVTMNGDVSVNANFTAIPIIATIVRNGTGKGIVTSRNGAINCGSVCTTPFNFLTGLELTATAGPGSVFVGWSGGGCKGQGICQPALVSATITATFSSSMHDLSADGKSDLIFRNSTTGQISAWLMNGTASTATAGLVPPGNWTLTHTADFNGDGKADILYRNDDGSVTLWLMNGLTLAGSAGLLGPNPDWRVSHVADFNGDGKADILWRNTNGAVTLWLMDGTTVVSSIGLLGADPGWSVSHVADFNGDGKADLLWRNTNGAVTLWLMNGTAIASTAGLLGADANWRISHVADFDGDGKADLLWRNTNGAVTAWLMNGTATASTAGLLGADANWSVSHTGDFNGDGKADLLWRNSNGAVTQWLMNGTGILSTAGLLGADANWRVTHIGDYNGDGKADLVWRNVNDGAITMWLMNGAVTLSAAGILGATTWGVTP